MTNLDRNVSSLLFGIAVGVAYGLLVTLLALGVL